MPKPLYYTRKNLKGKSRYLKKSRMPLSRAQARAVKKIANSSGEVKYLDIAVSPINPYDSNAADMMDGVLGLSQGDTKSTREGDNVFFRSLSWNGRILNNETTSRTLRFLVFQTMGKTIPTGLPLDNCELHLPRLDTSDIRYKVLIDRFINLSPLGQPGDQKVFKFKVNKVPIKKITYEAGSSTITSGNIYAYLINQNGSATADVGGDVNVRFTYNDN